MIQERREERYVNTETQPLQHLSEARYWLIVLIVSNCCYCHYSVIV